jgi:PIN domain nuclease of toxin-antitoxin system
MKLLADTNVVLWWLAKSPRLPGEIIAQLSDPEVEVCVSVASFWEMTIKAALGKLRVDMDEASVLFRRYGVIILPIELSHVKAVATLAHHHRDPFDRMLVAQAKHEGLTIVTSDRTIPLYGVPVLEV